MKKFVAIALALVVVFLVCTAESCTQTTSDLSGENDHYTLAMYDQVQTGMSHSQVDSIMGGGGSNTATTSFGSDTMTSWSYENPSGSNAQFDFTNDALDSKAQFGLK